MTVSTSTILTADRSGTKVDPAAHGSSIDMWIGSRVRVKRTSNGMTQHEFSKLLAIDRNDLAAFEAGARRINANLLFRIAKSLNVQPGYFFRGYTDEGRKPA